MPTRIRSDYPSVSGGGGGAGVVGTLEWGPDFGEVGGSDGTTAFVNRPVLTMPAVAVTRDQPVHPLIDLDALAVMNIQAAHPLIDLDAVIESTITTVVDTFDLDQVAISNNKTVVDTLTNPANAISNTKGVTQALTGNVLGAPFFQSTQTNSAADTLAGITSLTATKPSGTAAGDLLLMFVSSQSTSGTPGVSVADWTYITTGVTGQIRMDAFYRVADGSEPSSITVNFSVGRTHALMAIHRITAVDTTNPINAFANGSATVVDPVVPAVTTTVANCLVYEAVNHTHSLSQTHAPPSGHTEIDDFAVGTIGISTLWTATKVFAATGSTGTATLDCNEALTSTAGYVRIAVAPGTLVIA